jgi:hypothetical protein
MSLYHLCILHKKLCGLSLRPTERPLLFGEVNANLRTEGCRVVSATNPHGSTLVFLDQSQTFSFKYLLNCTHEAEWTPFQTHHFSENVVAPGIEPGSLDL